MKIYMIHLFNRKKAHPFKYFIKYILTQFNVFYFQTYKQANKKYLNIPI